MGRMGAVSRGVVIFQGFNKKQVDRYRNFGKGGNVTGFKCQYQYIVALICTDVKIKLKFLCDEVIAGETVFTALIFKERPSRWLSQLNSNVKVGQSL